MLCSFCCCNRRARFSQSVSVLDGWKEGFFCSRNSRRRNFGTSAGTTEEPTVETSDETTLETTRRLATLARQSADLPLLRFVASRTNSSVFGRKFSVSDGNSASTRTGTNLFFRRGPPMGTPILPHSAGNFACLLACSPFHQRDSYPSIQSVSNQFIHPFINPSIR